MEVCVQEPGHTDTSLLSRILSCIEGASAGGGVFAWANASGVHAVFGNNLMTDWLKTHPFYLVVGIDSITDLKAIAALRHFAQRFPLLSVRIFVHSSGSLFHPKTIWFMREDGATHVVGSGNFTMGGLVKNWEFFTVHNTTSKAEAAQLLQPIDSWLERSAAHFYGLDHPLVEKAAKKNVGNERVLKRPAIAAPEDKQESAFSSLEAAFVAVIPRSGNRWSQANFKHENAVEFFGYRDNGFPQELFLYHVDGAGVPGDLEIRQVVAVASQNYRVELGAGRGLDYPEQGRPIVSFLRLSSGEFLYRLLFPENAGHSELWTFLEENWNGPSRQMMWTRASVKDLQGAWPNSPLLKAELPVL